MVEQKATNVVWQEGKITLEQREQRNGHKGVVIWCTGLSGSGKSTLAMAVEQALFDRGCHTYVLDGDNVRQGMNKDLGFSPEDREENIRRIGEVAHLFADSGMIVLTAFISPYRADRRAARSLNAKGEFMEVFCECPLSECENRDSKGLYKKARAGEIKDFTGIDAPYEDPEDAELVVHTGDETVEESVRNVISYLEENGFLNKS